MPTRKMVLPQIKGNLLGNTQQFAADRIGFYRLASKQGDLVRIRLGTTQAVFVNNPEYIRQILVTDADKFHKGPLMSKIAKPIIGEGLLSSEDDFHKRQRRLAQPAFHHSRVMSYGDVMVRYTLKQLDGWQDGQTLDIAHEMMKVTQNIVAKTLFDADVSDDGDAVGDALTVSMRSASKRLGNPLAMAFQWLPSADKQQRDAAADILNNVVLKMVQERRASGEDKGDLLSMLLLAVDEEGTGSMTDQQVRDEAMTLFLAGHETTANTLAWTWYLLSQHPEIESRLSEELDRILLGRVPAVNDLTQLPYTEMIIKESMRLYPPAWSMARLAIRDIQFGDYTLPKGHLAMFSQYTMHRDPRYYGNPEAFIPERWTAEFEKNLPRYTYFPFGGGPRVCIGQAFAMMEARLLLATIAQRYRFALVADQKVEMEPLITLRPRNGIYVRLTQREFAAESPSANTLVR